MSDPAESVYIREETAQQIDDAKFEVNALLRREHDIRDLVGREFQDALLRIGASDPEALIEQIVNERSPINHYHRRATFQYLRYRLRFNHRLPRYLT